MNSELIKIAEQAGLTQGDFENMPNLALFTELLIKKCADIALWEQGKGYNVGDIILEKFDIK